MIGRRAAAHSTMRALLSPSTNNPLRQGYEVAEAAIRAVIAGRKPMQMICSRTGLGKTYLVRQQARRADIKPEFVSPHNEAALAETLYRLRDQAVIVLDDCDVLARSERVANLFKMAFGPRTVHYETKRTLAVDMMPRALTDAFLMMPSSFRVDA